MRARAVLVVPTALLAMLVVPVGPAGSAVPVDGLVSRLSVTSAGGQGDGPSVAADVAAGGRQVVFQSLADLTGTQPPPSSGNPAPPSDAPSAPGDIPSSRVYARDLTAGTTTALAGATGEDATAPSVSGDGRLVAYSGTRPGLDHGVSVVDRDPDADGVLDEPEQTLTRRVTGGVTDLRYQRPLACPGPFSESYGDNRSCAPQLSDDGTTLVLPARLDPVSDRLDVSLLQFGTASLRSAEQAAPEPGDMEVVDLGSAGTQFPTFAEITVSVRGPDPVTFLPASLAGDPGVFSIERSDCEGVVAPGRSCTITATFQPTPDTCPSDGVLHPSRAVLELNATTPAGQSVLQLVGECRQFPQTLTLSLRTAAAIEQAPACPAPDLAGLVARPVEPGTTGPGNPLVEVGGVQVGVPDLVGFPVGGGFVDFLPPSSCAMALVTPAPEQRLPGERPAPCVQGEQVSGCTAYVLFRPQAVGAELGLLDLGDGAYRVAGTGVRDVVVVRRDLTGAGDFALAPAVVGSVDGAGAVVHGTDPSVSADGRHVAFTSLAALDREPVQPSVAQVYRHDTDLAGDRTFASGATVAASSLPDGTLPVAAAEPSISGDGSRVAFTADGQVYLRALDAARTVLVSRAATGPVPGDSPSSAPALSADGTTVAFASLAADLLDPASRGDAVEVFARPVDPGLDLGGPAPPEHLSVTDTGERGDFITAADPTIDAHGRFVAFHTAAALAPADSNGIRDVYVHERLASPVLTPAALDFGEQPPGTVGAPRVVTLGNAGPGPLRVDTVEGTGPFAVDGSGCAGAVLQRGATCELSVSFAPTDAGPGTGGLVVRTGDGAPQALLSGTGSAPGSAPPVVAGPAPAPEIAVPGPAPQDLLGQLETLPVVRLGGALPVTGTNFPPGVPVTLSWAPGLGGATVTSDATGGFVVSVPVLPADITGDRLLQAGFPGVPVARSRLVLVVVPPVQPPDFTSR